MGGDVHQQIALRRRRQQPRSEVVVALVDFALLRESDRHRLQIGAFHQADRRREGEQAVEIGGRPAQVGLQCDADER